MVAPLWLLAYGFVAPVVDLIKFLYHPQLEPRGAEPQNEVGSHNGAICYTICYTIFAARSDIKRIFFRNTFLIKNKLNPVTVKSAVI
jgi:hypothetical protein